MIHAESEDEDVSLQNTTTSISFFILYKWNLKIARKKKVSKKKIPEKL